MNTAELFALIGNTPDQSVQQKLSDFEARYSVEMPELLRQVVVRSSGEEMDVSLQADFPASFYEGGYGRLFVDRFLTLSDDSRDAIRPLSDYFSDFGAPVEGVPPKIFCIAEDGFSNAITIDLRRDTHGAIAFVDHELIGERFDDQVTYQVVAPSFDQFIDMLQQDEPDPEEDT